MDKYPPKRAPCACKPAQTISPGVLSLASRKPRLLLMLMMVASLSSFAACSNSRPAPLNARPANAPPSKPIDIETEPKPSVAAQPKAPQPAQAKAPDRTNTKGLYLHIVQGASVQAVADRANPKVKRAPFFLRFPVRTYASNKHYSVRVAASSSPDVLGVAVGSNSQTPSPFAAGTGMAPSRSGRYEGLFLNGEAHHYLFYDTTSKSRVRHLRRLGAGRHEVAFDVAAIQLPDSVLPLSQTTLPRLFFAVFIDDNLNKVIDKGELFRFTLHLLSP